MICLLKREFNSFYQKFKRIELFRDEFVNLILNIFSNTESVQYTINFIAHHLLNDNCVLKLNSKFKCSLFLIISNKF